MKAGIQFPNFEKNTQISTKVLWVLPHGLAVWHTIKQTLVTCLRLGSRRDREKCIIAKCITTLSAANKVHFKFNCLVPGESVTSANWEWDREEQAELEKMKQIGSGTKTLVCTATGSAQTSVRWEIFYPLNWTLCAGVLNSWFPKPYSYYYYFFRIYFLAPIIPQKRGKSLAATYVGLPIKYVNDEPLRTKLFCFHPAPETQQCH